MIERIEARNLGDLKGVVHGFFGRRGGVSGGLYASLNAGLGSQDSPDNVAMNRQRVADTFGVSRLVTAYQVHGTGLVWVNADTDEAVRPTGDILITSEPAIAVGILTADCAPVLLADAEARLVAAVHAGWRGAVAGVAETAVEAMIKTGAVRDRIRAAIGPAIGMKAYQVGSELRDAFEGRGSDFERCFREDATDPGKYRFDLAGAVRIALQRAGIGSVESLGLDTYENSGRFFSYRRATHRGETDYGRQISAIALL